MAAIFKVNYQSHLAMRVLLPLRSFEVREKMDLYDQVLHPPASSFTSLLLPLCLSLGSLCELC
jgi:23S rRNA G2445 N2-methylase RlmL